MVTGLSQLKPPPRRKPGVALVRVTQPRAVHRRRNALALQTKHHATMFLFIPFDLPSTCMHPQASHLRFRQFPYLICHVSSAHLIYDCHSDVNTDSRFCGFFSEFHVVISSQDRGCALGVSDLCRTASGLPQFARNPRCPRGSLTSH